MALSSHHGQSIAPDSFAASAGTNESPGFGLPLFTVSEFVRFRHQVDEPYFEVDCEIVCKTIHADLPAPYGQVQHVVDNID